MKDIDMDQNGVSRRALFAGTAAVGAGVMLAGAALGQTSVAVRSEDEISALPRVTQKMVAPLFLPEHEQVATTGPKVVEVRLVIEEKIMQVDDYGAEIWALTFNGSVPGPMIVVHEGDYVEVTLVNLATNEMEHNIDFHASTGAMGGGALSLVLPGEEATFRFLATKSGVFVYHCAPGGEMIPYHVCHGMNGALMVLPREGLSDKDGKALPYDKAYFIGEQDYYIKKDENGDYLKYEFAGEDFVDFLDVAQTLIPSHIVFNGAVGALTGDNALTANVGETVLLLHAQANRDTRPHLIGGHGDYVWAEGSFSNAPLSGLETWHIAGGAAGAALYTFRQPGLYAYVNHNLIEAIIKGAAAHFQVEGEWDDNLMKQIKPPTAI